MDFSKVKSLSIPEGGVKKIQVNGVVIWGEPSPPIAYTDLVPNALATDGSILDGIGYRRKVTWSGSSLVTASAFTAIGLIPIDGSVSHDIYVYGLNFTGTTNNRYGLFSNTFSNLAQTSSINVGTSDAYISSITKLDENYFKITTKTYSTKVQYFGISGVTISGITPIVTIDEPII